MEASGSRRAFARIKRSKVAWFGISIICFLFLAGIFGPSLLIDPGPNTISSMILAPPSSAAWFGTDELGRSVLTQIVYGVRTSLVVGLLAAASAITIGITVGAAAGYLGGAVDAFLMRTTEVFQVVPTFVFASIIVAMAGTGMLKVVLVIAILAWPQAARLMRSQVMKVKSMEFVDGVRCLGVSELQILVREILPNAVPPVIAVGTLIIGHAILLEASLAFFGLTSPDAPSWGRLLTSGQRYFYFAWWLSVFPGIFIVLTVLAFNLLGDVLNQAFNPRADH